MYANARHSDARRREVGTRGVHRIVLRLLCFLGSRFGSHGLTVNLLESRVAGALELKRREVVTSRVSTEGLTLNEDAGRCSRALP